MLDNQAITADWWRAGEYSIIRAPIDIDGADAGFHEMARDALQMRPPKCPGDISTPTDYGLMLAGRREIISVEASTSSVYRRNDCIARAPLKRFHLPAA